VNNFLSLADFTALEIENLLDSALRLKREWAGGGNAPILSGRTLGLLFQKPSLRTRVSFEMGMLQLGGQALYLSPNEIQLGKRESVADVARVLSRYVDGIMARVFAHADILELAAYSSVPVINGLSDLNHPCQGLADLLTVYEHVGKLKGAKLAYVGDGNNVATSLLIGGAITGMHVSVATPPGYEVSEAVEHTALAAAEQSGASIELSHNPRETVRGADALYTDTWTSMGQEAEASIREGAFGVYQVNQELVSATGNEKVIVMHCLPAHRGHEITDQVADGPNSVIFDQAENRMHAQKAILAELLASA